VWNQQLASNGIASYAVNAKASLIAVAEQSAQPSVTVYRHPDLEVQAEFTDGAEFEFSAIAFSRDGQRLVALSGRTDFQVNVWDLASRQRVPGVGGAAPHRITAVSFNPRDNGQFCGVSRDGIFFWAVEKRFDDFRLVMKRGQPHATTHSGAAAAAAHSRPQVDVGGVAAPAAGPSSGSNSDDADDAPVDKALGLLGGSKEDPHKVWVCHAWTVDGHVVAANDAGRLVKVRVCGSRGC